MDDDTPQEWDWDSLNEMFAWMSDMTSEQKAAMQQFAGAFRKEIEATNTESEAKELLFVGSQGSTIIKMLHYPYEVLEEEGPVLLPSADKQVLLGAVADELIMRKVAEYSDAYPDDFTREHRWQAYLNMLAHELTAMQAEMRDSSEFDDLLLAAHNPQPRKYDEWPYDQDEEEG